MGKKDIKIEEYNAFINWTDITLTERITP